MIEYSTSDRRVESILLKMFEYSVNHNSKEVLQYLLDEGEKLTGSSIGFYHFVDEDEDVLKLQTWSTNTLNNMCNAEGEGSHYAIEEAGVWVDCIRERQSIIHNNYASLPHKKGLPEGHAPVIREAVVPVFRGGKIVAVLGVGNKQTPYVESDIELLEVLASFAHETVIRKHQEEELEQNRELLNDVINSITDVFFTLDDNMNYLFWNKAAEKVTGISQEDILGRSWFDFEFNRQKMWIAEKYRYTIETGKSVSFENTIPNGEGEEYYLVNTYRMKNGITVLYRNISYLKEIQTRLKQSEERYKHYFNLTHEGIAYMELLEPLSLKLDIQDQEDWMFNKLIVKECNLQYAMMNGYTHPRQIIGKTPVEYQVDVESSRGMSRAVVQQNYKMVNVENKKEFPNGTTRIYLTSSFDVADENYVYGIWVIMQDITEVKRSQIHMMELDKVKSMSVLAGSLAHDFNNILTGISLHLSLVKSGMDNRETIDDIQKAVDQGASLVKQLQNFSKSQTHTKSRVDLREILEFTSRLSLQGSKCTYKITIDNDVSSIFVDPGQFSQVMTNLILNSEEAMPEGGEIFISAKNIEIEEYDPLLPSGDYVRISIEDLGNGIPDDIKSKVFLPYFSTKNEGTGLGLASCKAIIDSHGGKITFISKVGQGTIFHIYLPNPDL